MLLCSLWLIHDQGIWSYGHVLDARWARCCLVERQGSVRQHRRLLSNTAEQGRRTDKRELQKGLFPPGFSSRAWQCSEPVSLILPPGQSLASSPDGGWTGGWTERLGREWWLVPDYTSGDWVPFFSSSSRYMPGTATETGCSPVSVLKQGVKLFISNTKWCYGSAIKSMQNKLREAITQITTKWEKNVVPNNDLFTSAQALFWFIR